MCNNQVSFGINRWLDGRDVNTGIFKQWFYLWFVWVLIVPVKVLADDFPLQLVIDKSDYKTRAGEIKENYKGSYLSFIGDGESEIVRNISCLKSKNELIFQELDSVFVRVKGLDSWNVHILLAYKFDTLIVSDSQIDEKFVKMERPLLSDSNSDLYNFIVGYCDLVNYKKETYSEPSFISSPDYTSMGAALAQYCKNDIVCMNTLKPNVDYTGFEYVESDEHNIKGTISYANKNYKSYSIKTLIKSSQSDRQVIVKNPDKDTGFFEVEFENILPPGSYNAEVFITKNDLEVDRWSAVISLTIPEPPQTPVIIIDTYNHPFIKGEVLHYKDNMSLAVHQESGNSINESRDVVVDENGVFRYELKGSNDIAFKVSDSNGVLNEHRFSYSPPKGIEGWKWLSAEMAIRISVDVVVLLLLWWLLSLLRKKKATAVVPASIPSQGQQTHDSTLSAQSLERLKEVVKSTIEQSVQPIQKSLLETPLPDTTQFAATEKAKQDVLEQTQKLSRGLASVNGALHGILTGRIKINDKHERDIRGISEEVNNIKPLVTNIQMFIKRLGEQPTPATTSTLPTLDLTSHTQQITATITNKFSKLANDGFKLESTDITQIATEVEYKLTPLQHTLNEIKQSLINTNQLQQTIDSLTASEASLTAELATVTQQLNEAKELLDSRNNEVTDKSSEVTELTAKLDEQVRIYQQLEQQQATAQQQIDALHKAKKELDKNAAYAFKQFINQLSKDSNIKFPVDGVESLKSVVSMLSKETDEDIYSAFRKDAYYREGIANVYNIIYWHHWLGLHQSIIEAADHLWKCLIASLAYRGIYIDNLISNESSRIDQSVAVDEDFASDVFFLSDIDLLAARLRHAVAFLFKLEVGLNVTDKNDSTQLSSFVNEAIKESSRLGMGELCNKLGLEDVGMFKVRTVGLSKHDNGKKELARKPKIKTF